MNSMIRLIKGLTLVIQLLVLNNGDIWVQIQIRVYTSNIKVKNVDSGTDPNSDGFLFDRKMVNFTLNRPGYPAIPHLRFIEMVTNQRSQKPEYVLQPSFFIESQEGYIIKGMVWGFDLTLHHIYYVKSFDDNDPLDVNL